MFFSESTRPNTSLNVVQEYKLLETLVEADVGNMPKLDKFLDSLSSDGRWDMVTFVTTSDDGTPLESTETLGFVRHYVLRRLLARDSRPVVIKRYFHLEHELRQHGDDQTRRFHLFQQDLSPDDRKLLVDFLNDVIEALPETHPVRLIRCHALRMLQEDRDEETDEDE